MTKRRGQSGWEVGASAALAVVSMVTLWPLGWALFKVVAGAAKAGPGALVEVAVSPGLLARTVGWAALIGGIATVLGTPIALCVRRWGWAAAAPAMAALAMPTYLAYSGWGMARAPRTLLGDRIELLAQQGAKWLPTAVGTGLAIAGLALWAAPLAGVVMAAAWRRLDRGVLDAWKCEPAMGARGRLLRWEALARMGAPGALAGAGLVMLVVIGSAVPLHLANVETISIRAWLELTQSASGEQWRAAASCWPVIGAALVAGWLVSGRALREEHEASGGDDLSAGRARWSAAFAVGVVVLAVGVPLVLFVTGIPGLRQFATTWRASRSAMVGSAGIAALAGLVGAGLAVCAYVGAGTGGIAGRAGRLGARAMVVAALVPGIVVGWATSDAWNAWPALAPVADSAVVLVAAHVARYGAIGVLIGWWLRRIEAREERELRDVDGAAGARGWLAACAPAQRGAIAAAGLATSALSFHEIEASIFVQPTGVRSFARQMLDHLHFFRTSELSAAGVVIVGASVVLALGAAAGLAGTARGRRVGMAGREQ